MTDLVGSVLIAPGFFQSDAVRTAIVTGGIVAVVSGVVGVFTVVRGQSFAGHALGDMGTLGGSASYLVGVNPFVGFVVVGLVVSGTMELLGIERRSGRDVATGIVLGAALGVSALLLYLDTTVTTTTGATVTVLFGSLFSVSASIIPFVVILAVLGVAIASVLYRPLLLSSVSADLAVARGVSPRAMGLGFILVLGVTVALTSVVVGTILSTALLIGPAAAALRLTRRPWTAMIVAATLGVGSTWLGILLAYDSYDWPPDGRGWPVSFLVVAVIFTVYLATDLVSWARSRRTVPAAAGGLPVPAETAGRDIDHRGPSSSPV